MHTLQCFYRTYFSSCRCISRRRSHSFFGRPQREIVPKNVIVERKRDGESKNERRLDENEKEKGKEKERMKKKVTKSKSLIKTVLFAAELSITWLLLLFSFSVFLTFFLLQRTLSRFSLIHSLTHTLSHCFAISFVT